MLRTCTGTLCSVRTCLRSVAARMGRCHTSGRRWLGAILKPRAQEARFLSAPGSCITEQFEPGRARPLSPPVRYMERVVGTVFVCPSSLHVAAGGTAELANERHCSVSSYAGERNPRTPTWSFAPMSATSKAPKWKFFRLCMLRLVAGTSYKLCRSQITDGTARRHNAALNRTGRHAPQKDGERTEACNLCLG